MLTAIAFWPTAAIAERKCDNPRSTIDQRACAKAAEGPDALRRFVARTQTIWGLYYWDYARLDEPRTTPSATVRLAVPVDAAPKAATATIEAR
jgi:hypothetical protein